MLTDVKSIKCFLSKGTKKIHFVGIGGIGMSGLARLLLEMGYKISGSDKVDSFLTRNLAIQGAKIFIGHSEKNITDDINLVVYSSSISSDNSELLMARENKIPIIHRSDLLAYLMQPKIGIAVAGAHGKTTTTALIAHILYTAGLDPTCLVGGWVNAWDSNSRLGKGNFLVVESDESDGSFLKLSPVYTVVNNIDFEHLDYYKDIEQIVQTYRHFMERTRECGCVFYGFDDPYLREILADYKLRSINYGRSPGADIYCKEIRLDKYGVEFRCIYLGENLGKIKLSIPGIHNVLNATAALAVAKELNINWRTIKEALFSYQGTKRRFQIKKEKPIMVIDDYAHHPTQIKATLEIASAWRKNRIITVFQPHRYSRVFYLEELFAEAFSHTDKLVITDIYPAGEKPIVGVSGEKLCKAILNKDNDKDVLFLSKDKIIPYLLSMVKGDDLVLMLGAGDITELTDELVEKLDHVS